MGQREGKILMKLAVVHGRLGSRSAFGSGQAALVMSCVRKQRASRTPCGNECTSLRKSGRFTATSWNALEPFLAKGIASRWR